MFWANTWVWITNNGCFHQQPEKELADYLKVPYINLFTNGTLPLITIDYLKNFGFAGETTIIAPGINSKMDEIRFAYGLLNLRQVDSAIEARHQVAIKYREALQNIEGITFFDDMPGVKHNYSYFSVFVDAEKYGMTRDELYFKMKEHEVLGHPYFYPLISTFSTYRDLDSAKPELLPNTHNITNSVICLPLHHESCKDDIE